MNTATALKILEECVMRENQLGRADDEARLLLHPAPAEAVGARLMRAVRVGAASNVRFVRQGEPLCPLSWVAKAIDGSRLRWAPPSFAGPRIAVRKIPGAIPLTWLRSKYGVTTPKPVTGHAPKLDKLNNNFPLRASFGFQAMQKVLWLGKGELLNAAEFYSDFQPPADWSKIRSAIRWDSNEMLKIHAARLFLGCSTAHASNILIDGNAKLYSIDHERIYSTDGGEIDLLFESVRPGTRAFAALQPVAQLTLARLREVFPPALVPHYGARLERWQRGCYGSRSAPKTFQFSK